MTMSMRNPLNSSTGPQVLRFFDVCFKRGVADAMTLGDDSAANEFVIERKEDWKFGVLGEPDDFDWKMFRFRLYQWARESHLSGLAENYLFNLRAINPYWVLLIYCMRFYLMGVSEWLEYPNPQGMAIFKNTPRAHWAPQKKGLMNFKKADYFAYMQEFAIDYRRSSLENRLVSTKALEAYCMALYSVNRCIK